MIQLLCKKDMIICKASNNYGNSNINDFSKDVIYNAERTKDNNLLIMDNTGELQRFCSLDDTEEYFSEIDKIEP